MFPWNNFLGDGYPANWYAFNVLLNQVTNLLGWDLIKGVLAFAAASMFAGYIVSRLRRIAGV
jgi:hypothetical protein